MDIWCWRPGKFTSGNFDVMTNGHQGNLKLGKIGVQENQRLGKLTTRKFDISEHLCSGTLASGKLDMQENWRQSKLPSGKIHVRSILLQGNFTSENGDPCENLMWRTIEFRESWRQKKSKKLTSDKFSVMENRLETIITPTKIDVRAIWRHGKLSPPTLDVRENWPQGELMQGKLDVRENWSNDNAISGKFHEKVVQLQGMRCQGKSLSGTHEFKGYRFRGALILGKFGMREIWLHWNLASNENRLRENRFEIYLICVRKLSSGDSDARETWRWGKSTARNCDVRENGR